MNLGDLRPSVSLRFQFQERPWDLYLALGYTLVSLAIILGLGHGRVEAIFLIIFVPGYMVTAALFPNRGAYKLSAENEAGKPSKESISQDPSQSTHGIDWTERLALSFGCSIAIVPLIGLLLNFSPWGMSLYSVAPATGGFSCLMGFAAYYRRMMLPAKDRLSATFNFRWPAWREYGGHERLLIASLAVAFLLSLGSLAYVLATAPPAPRLTQFFLLGPGGKAMDYPTALNVSQPGTVIVGVVNREGRATNFSIQISLIGIRIMNNQTVEMNRTTLAWYNLSLENGANWVRAVSFSISFPGAWKIDFELHMNANFAVVYRELHLYVQVS